MKRTLILLAGPPATGKSYLVSEMRKVIPDFFLITPDEVKEMYADKYGFSNLEEKTELEIKVWKFYYHILEHYMVAGKKVVVSEYPFSNKQKPQLSALALHNDYRVITIRLIANFETLWQRRKVRDLDSDRHLSHLMSHYQPGDVLLDRTLTDNRITKKDFATIIKERQYNAFSLGQLFEVDVTDFSKVDYNDLLAEIKELL